MNAQAQTEAVEAVPASPSSEALPPATPINLTFSPITLSLQTVPGIPVTGTIKIRNNGTTTEILDVNFGTFKAGPTGDNPQLLEPSPEDTFMEWIRADQDRIVIEPGEWQSVDVTFAPPPEASLSYYYTVLFPRHTEVAEPGQTVVQGVPAVFALTTVSTPNARRELALREFKVTKPLLEYLSQSFEITIENLGNVHLQPTGNIFIDSQSEKNIGVLSINPNNLTILPQSKRTYTVEWNDGFPVRRSDGSLDWDLTKAHLFRFGRYTAHILMVYDNGERDVPVESYVTFWIIPWKLSFLVLLVIILSALGVRSLFQSVFKSIHSRSLKS